MHIQNDYRTTEPDQEETPSATGHHTNIKTTLSGRVSTTSAGRFTVQVPDSDTRQRQQSVAIGVTPRGVALSERSRRVGESPTRKPLSEAHADAYHYIYFVYGRPKKSSGSIEVFYDNSHALTAVNPGPIDDPRTQEVA